METMSFYGKVKHPEKEKYENTSGTCRVCGKDILDMYEDDSVLINGWPVCFTCYTELDLTFNALKD